MASSGMPTVELRRGERRTDAQMRHASRAIRPLPALIALVSLMSACTGQPTLPPSPSPTFDPVSAVTAPSQSPSTPLPEQIRPASFAGSWYPSDPEELTAMVDQMLSAVQPMDGAPVGLIVPHAGYAYSGPVAAAGFRQLAGGEHSEPTAGIRVAVIIASDHQHPLSDPISIWAGGGFETPLGIVPVDEELAQALIEADPRITCDPAAHEGEHPIEIELPFLQRVCPDCCIVPVLMGTDDEETVRALADALLETLPGRRAVVIASSDLSHYPSYEDALVVDGATLAAIRTGDPTRVRAAVAASMAKGTPNLATCACGTGPILVTMRVAQGLGADTVSVLRYTNSGDSPAGDRSQVVGYGAVMLWRYEPPDLTEAQRKELLVLAHTTIREYLETGQILDYETEDPTLTRRSRAFVTLREGGQLRGCIGHTVAKQPLYRVIQETAASAATKDPRFPPLTPDELTDPDSSLEIEISILSPFRPVTDVTQIRVGTHGLAILKGAHQGLLLPQVPVEQGWDRETFLEQLCRKAGLPSACWWEDAVDTERGSVPASTLYAFTAVVFGE